MSKLSWGKQQEGTLWITLQAEGEGQRERWALSGFWDPRPAGPPSPLSPFTHIRNCPHQASSHQLNPLTAGWTQSIIDWKVRRPCGHWVSPLQSYLRLKIIFVLWMNPRFRQVWQDISFLLHWNYLEHSHVCLVGGIGCSLRLSLECRAECLRVSSARWLGLFIACRLG